MQGIGVEQPGRSPWENDGARRQAGQRGGCHQKFSFRLPHRGYRGAVRNGVVFCSRQRKIFYHFGLVFPYHKPCISVSCGKDTASIHILNVYNGSIRYLSDSYPLKAFIFHKVNPPATVPTLRYAFATHLLEKVVDLRYIQDLLGHESSKTTEIYTYITKKGWDKLRSPMDDLDI